MSGQPWGSEWFELADMDFSAAEYLLGMRPLPVEIICYHCEQAVEKLLTVRRTGGRLRGIDALWRTDPLSLRIGAQRSGCA